MRVLMVPHLNHFRSEESGIKRVVEAYFQYLPEYGVEFVDPDATSYDLVAAHAGLHPGADVAHCHGLYWTADYPAAAWEWRANRDVIETLRHAKQITVPSEWVAEAIRRDMRRNPVVIPHGIDWDAWQHDQPNGGYVLWNKNRSADVCDPTAILWLARAYPETHFVTTFPPDHAPGNVTSIGVIPHEQMQQLVQGAAVYLSTTKETFGIGTLEAMAAGIPVLGFARGGNLELVEHGVNGYLAEPASQDDLIAGLAYCLEHRTTLGKNGRYLAKQYTWQAAAEKVAAVYHQALKDEPATVSIVIPCYNYGDKVGRAIESAISQTYDHLTDVIVVDDGSEDVSVTARTVEQYAERDGRVRLIRQHNQGVAIARNRGIADSGSTYICCLDADDAIEPTFLEKCIPALEADPGLGIAYTRIRHILPDGKTGVSPWPGEWNFDRQVEGGNQVPTCCVFRRSMWESLGGYRARYCPQGAGAEDAEFWLRSGAYGWRAQLVTNEPLFIYSLGSGRVAGNKDYREPDWLAWHPWTRDKLHPFASYAKSKRYSHPVRQADEPVVSVIIPVGPKHTANVIDALDSVEAQTFRYWEVIVVWDTEEIDETIRPAYPFARFIQVGPDAGAGYARNRGAEFARAPFLLFLDADDWLYPEALEGMLGMWEETNAVVYSDYIGKAYIGDAGELARNLQRQIVWRMEDGLTAIRYEAPEYDWRRAQRQPDGDPTKVYTWNLITSLVPKQWHQELDGFDETMPSWEDVDYWWRMAKAGKPFARIPEPLVVYHFYSGGRRDLGQEQHKRLFDYLRKKHKEIEPIMCRGCGGRRSSTPAPAPTAVRPGMMKASGSEIPGLHDPAFVEAVYTHPNQNPHTIIGQHGFPHRLEGIPMIHQRDGLWYIKYGVRGGGERMLVHKEDIRTAQHLFQRVDTPAQAPPQRPEPPPVPRALEQRHEPEPEPELELVADLRDKEAEEPRYTAAPVDLEAVVAGTLPRKEAPEPGKGNGPLREEDFVALQRIPGVTEAMARQLLADGHTDAEAILMLGEEGLKNYRGIGPARAKVIYASAQRRVQA